MSAQGPWNLLPLDGGETDEGNSSEGTSDDLARLEIESWFKLVEAAKADLAKLE
jgi:hypothetical protein